MNGSSLNILYLKQKNGLTAAGRCLTAYANLENYYAQ